MLRHLLMAYLNEAPEETVKKEKIKIYTAKGVKEIEIEVYK